MGTWVSMIASAVIGSLVLLWFNDYNNDFRRDSYLNMMEDISYNNLEEVTNVIEYDFSRVGFGMNDPSAVAVLQADSSNFEFELDSNGDGVIETMQYYLSDTSDASDTPNPRDRILYRVDNGGTPERLSSGLTEFQMTYYGADGDTTSDKSAMRSFGVRIVMENEVVYDEQTPIMAWESRITPRALIMY